MNIALIGYGKMGHEVEAIAIARGHNIVARFDVPEVFNAKRLRESAADTIIEFTEPSAVIADISMAMEANLPIIIGTTGWDEQYNIVKEQVEKSNGALVFASNFSIGVNLFLKIVRESAKLLQAEEYDVYISEAHHNRKKDFPSGTALRIADEILSEFDSKINIESSLKQGEVPDSASLYISSIRAGSIVGTHTVGFESSVDSIELTHRAASRKGFALGAVRAAEWIVGKKGIYKFEEHITEILQLKK